MATKRKLYKPNWKIVALGAFIFVGLGLGLLTAYQAGADDQMEHMQSTMLESSGR